MRWTPEQCTLHVPVPRHSQTWAAGLIHCQKEVSGPCSRLMDSSFSTVHATDISTPLPDLAAGSFMLVYLPSDTPFN